MSRPTPQEIQDLRDAPKADKAYMDSLTSTSPNPKKPKPRSQTKAIEEIPMEYKKGGSVRRRFNEGGLADFDIKDDLGTGDSAMYEKEPEAPKKQSFKEAFAEARLDGDKTFMWEGKKYTTELAKPKAKAPEPKATDPTKSRVGIINRMRESDKAVTGVKPYAKGGSVRGAGCAIKGWGKAGMR